MIEISFEINDKQVDPDDIAEGIERSVLKKIEELLEENLGELRCPEHGVAPSILCKGDGLNNLSLQVWACCQNFVDNVVSEIDDEADERVYRANIEIQGEEAHKHQERLSCPRCKRETTHVLQYAQTYEFMRDYVGLPYKFCFYVWLIWKCIHCGSLILEDTYKTPEWFEGKPWDGDYYLATFYPDAQKREDPDFLRSVMPPDNLNAKSFAHVPRKIKRAYTEIILAFNHHQTILCTMGLRGVLEEIADDKKVAEPDDPHWKKIRNLTALGIPVGVIENLLGILELGHSAVHELASAKSTDLRRAIDLIEQILGIVYEMEPRSMPLKKHWQKAEQKREERKHEKRKKSDTSNAS